MKRRFVILRVLDGEGSFLRPESWRRGVPLWDTNLQSARRLRQKKACKVLAQLEGMEEGALTIHEVGLVLLDRMGEP